MAKKRHKKNGRQSRASLITLIVLALLLIAASIALVFSLPEDQTLLEQTQTTAQAALLVSEGFDCTASEAMQLYPFAGGVVKLTSARLASLDVTGSENFATELDYVSPFAVSSDDYFLAADRNSHDFTILDRNGICFSGRADGLIVGASLSDQGIAAIISDQNDSTGVVSIYDIQTQTKRFDCIFAESGYVLSVSFPPGEDCFDVALVNTSSAQARPLIKRYSLDGQLIGQRIPDRTSLYPIIRYDAENHPVLCGPAELIAVSYDSNEVYWQHSFIQVVAVEESDDGLVAIAADSEMEVYRILLLGKDGKIEASEIIGEQVTILSIQHDLAVVAGGSNLQVISTQDGEILSSQMADAEIIRADFADDGNLTVVTRAGVRRFSVLD